MGSAALMDIMTEATIQKRILNEERKRVNEHEAGVTVMSDGF